MAINRIQFQLDLSLPEFLVQFGTDERCANALEASRWPQGFRCPACGNAGRCSENKVPFVAAISLSAEGRKPKDLPEFNWINMVLGNLKTSMGGAYHAFDFAKYGTRYLGCVCLPLQAAIPSCDAFSKSARRRSNYRASLSMLASAS
ncbi:MAG: hypothetical protein NMNS02_28250 [Nitrosomonas sp.]|nr:MAG: hypothetical protein NMNS02_28250 [Nitrosomonas sp.]